MAFNNELQLTSGEITKNRFLVDKKISWEFLPIGYPHFNGYCERALGILKSIMKKAVKNKLLTLDQLMTVSSYAQAVFNERPLCVMDNGDPNVIPLTPNSLTLGRNLRQFAHSVTDSDDADPDFSLSSAKCISMNKKLRDTLASVHKNWVTEYLGFLARKDGVRQKNAPCTKSLIVPKINDWVLIKDNARDLKLGKIIKLIKSEDDGEIRKVILKIKESQYIHPITNLRLLECHDSNESVKNQINDVIDSRPQRKAAKVALNKIKKM